MARVVGWLAVVVVVAAAGCGGGADLHPVTGTVLYEGAPAAGAMVVFHPAGATDPLAPKPYGVVQADGTFTLSTHPAGAGAAAGDYIVLVTWHNRPASEKEEAQDRLGERYSTAEVSQLRATVKPGSNNLEPFRLTK